MIQLKVLKASLSDDTDVRQKISRIFVEGFYQWLHFFSKDKAKLTKAFAHMFRLDNFYVAVTEKNAIVGISACTNGRQPSVHIDKKEMRRHLGFFRGTIAGQILRGEFENHPYPFEVAATMGSVEFVAVDPAYRGQGVASALLHYIHKEEPYQKFVLEVADTNTNAVKLYENLGYTELTRIAQKHPRQSGINHLLYLQYEKQG